MLAQTNKQQQQKNPANKTPAITQQSENNNSILSFALRGSPFKRRDSKATM
jgi:hypothetical protein